MMENKNVDQCPHSSTRSPVPPPVLLGTWQFSLAIAKTLYLFLDCIINIFILFYAHFYLNISNRLVIFQFETLSLFSPCGFSLGDLEEAVERAPVGMGMSPPKPNKNNPKYTELCPLKSSELGDSKTTLNLLIYYRYWALTTQRGFC